MNGKYSEGSAIERDRTRTETIITEILEQADYIERKLALVLVDQNMVKGGDQERGSDYLVASELHISLERIKRRIEDLNARIQI